MCFLRAVNVPNRAMPIQYHACLETLKNQNIIALLWPARSPELVPIEHVLDI